MTENLSHGVSPAELHVPYRWCSKDDCACYLPECAEHGCMEVEQLNTLQLPEER